MGLAILLAAPMSQLGHALAYWLQGVPGDRGVHAYFPNLLTAAGATAGAALLAAFLLVGLGRLLDPGWRRQGAPVALAPLLIALLSCQLLVFICQETLELATVGRAPSLLLLAWGVAGQAPVALLAALALRWLSQRLRPALRALRMQRAAAVLWAPLASEGPCLEPASGPRRAPRPVQHGLRAPPALSPA